MKRSLFVLFLAAFLVLLPFNCANGGDEAPSATVAIYSGSSGCIFWKNATDVEIQGTVVKFRSSKGEKITIVNCATVIHE